MAAALPYRIALLLVVALLPLAWAESIIFINPISLAEGAVLIYTIGDQIDVTWLSAFEYTTLRVWQGPLGDGTYEREVLAANQTRENSSFTWTATGIGNAGLSSNLHFELLNGHDATCENCTANSVTFAIRPRSATSTTTSSSSPTSSTTSSTSSATSTSAGGALNHAHHHPNLAIPLGVGLGVGVFVLLAILGIALCCILRRRKKQRRAASLPRGRQPSMANRSTWSTENTRHSDQAMMYPNPAYMPGRRPSYTRSSGVTDHSRESSRSYFEPFEFERPGSNDFGPLFDQWGSGNGGRGGAGSGGGVVGGANASRLSAIDEQHPPDWPLRTHRP